MPEGGTLLLEAHIAEAAAIDEIDAQSPLAGRYVVLRVADTGGGIPPEILDRIFDPFFTTKGPEVGTGLGLFSAAGIVKGHGGFIKVDPRYPRGAAFSVYLPAQEVATAAPLAAMPTPEFRGNGETVLYVDDERDVRDAAAAVLKRLNLTPLLAEDGTTGLAQATEHRESLRAVITDIHMAHTDVLAFVRALHQVLPDTPIIVASGRLEGPLAGELRQLGVTITLDKPFTQAMLANALRMALHHS
jgi:CheY-like chemotaxis protein